MDAVTETFALIGQRGVGKTQTASVLIEEMLEQRRRVTVVDPIGVWWGQRSSEDGKPDGYPVVIFDGDHADLPIEPTAGELIANLVVDEADLYARQRPPKVLYAVHGEPESSAALAARVRSELGWLTVVPRDGERVRLG